MRNREQGLAVGLVVGAVLLGLLLAGQVDEAGAQWPTVTPTPTERAADLVGLGKPAEIEDWLVTRTEDGVWLTVTLRSRTLWEIVEARLVCATYPGLETIVFKPARIPGEGLATAYGWVGTDWEYSCRVEGMVQAPLWTATRAPTEPATATSTIEPATATRTPEPPTEAPSATPGRQAGCCSCWLPWAVG